MRTLSSSEQDLIFTIHYDNDEFYKPTKIHGAYVQPLLDMHVLIQDERGVSLNRNRIRVSNKDLIEFI